MAQTKKNVASGQNGVNGENEVSGAQSGNKQKKEDLVLRGQHFSKDAVIEGLKAGKEYDFDPDDLPELGSEVFEYMDLASRMRYEKARAQAEENEARKSGKFRARKVKTLGILGNSELAQLERKDRFTKRGYRSTWVRQDEAAEMLAEGYERVKDEQGRTLQAGTTPEGNAEMIAIQIPYDIYKEGVVDEMRERSQRYFKKNREDFAETAERVNSQIGVSGEGRVTVFSEEESGE